MVGIERHFFLSSQGIFLNSPRVCEMEQCTMSSLMNRLKSAGRAMFPGNDDQSGDPLVVDIPGPENQNSDQADDATKTTGPLPRVHTVQPSRVSHFERQRKQIDSFDEDYADRWDRVKLFAAKIVALVLPIIAVLAIGDELGRYFTRYGGSTWSQYWIAYAGEAALTYILGSIFGRSEKSASHYIKMTVTGVIWLGFILASAWGQWAVAESALPAHPETGLIIAIWLRIGMACMLDAASVAIMFWRGKSLTKYLTQLQQKADATIRVNEAELTIQRAQATAEQRQKEDELYLRGKEQAQDVVMRVQELQGQALIEQARAALDLPDGQTGRGRQLRGRW